MTDSSRPTDSLRWAFGALAASARWPLGCFVAILLFIAGGPLWTLRAEDASQVVQPTALVGHKVTLTMVAGETIAGAEVLQVQEGEVPGCIRLITIRDPVTGQPRPLIANTISSVAPAGNATRYVLDKESRRLLPDDPALAEQIKSAIAEGARGKSKAKPDKGATAEGPTTKKKSDPPDTDKPKKKKKKGEDEIPLRPGVSFWPELTEEEQKKAVVEHKEHLKKIQASLSDRRFTFVETEYFLFFSDLPPADLQFYVPYMDAMYKRLLAFFELKAGTNIWRGKALVIIFTQSEAYLAYEKNIHNYDAPDFSAGLCHPKRNGDVITSVRTNKLDRKGLAAVIVHETTHGFVWRYKTDGIIPSWVNEGLSDYVANMVVPGISAIEEKLAMRDMQRHGTMGIGFFGKRINPDQYAVAFNLTKYMIAADPKRYKRFFESLKAGMTEEEALQEVYGIRREVLVAQYGRAIGLPNLRPDPSDAPLEKPKPKP